MINRRSLLSVVGAASGLLGAGGARGAGTGGARGVGTGGARGTPLRPPALQPGQTVGLITPSTYVADPDRIVQAERTVLYFGLQCKIGKNVRKRDGYLGGTVAERLDDLHAMFRDPQVRAIFAVRGGFGAAHLLDQIDYDLVRKNPKILLGYSDITALHLALHKRAGLITFHGPTALSAFTSYTQTSFRKVLFEAQPPGPFTNPPETNPFRPAHTLRVVRGGTGRGPLIGGNLSIITSLMGTPYEIETRGRLLFLEDVGEEPYRIDRMLTQLRLAGKLDGVAGVIFGECKGCVPGGCQAGVEASLSVGEIVDRILGPLRVPVLSGLTIGHTEDQLTLPLGVMATLDADNGSLVLEEPGVRAT